MISRHLWENGFSYECRLFSVFFWRTHITTGQNGWEVNSLLAESSKRIKDV